MRRAWPTGGGGAAAPKKNISVGFGLHVGNVKFRTHGETRTSVPQNDMYGGADKSLARTDLLAATSSGSSKHA